MSNTNNIDARAGAFCDIKVNCNWWSDNIYDCCHEYVEKKWGDNKVMEDWVFALVKFGEDQTYEEMFWKEWNDKLHSYLTKMLMGDMEAYEIHCNFCELVNEYIDKDWIIIEYEDFFKE